MHFKWLTMLSRFRYGGQGYVFAEYSGLNQIIQGNQKFNGKVKTTRIVGWGN